MRIADAKIGKVFHFSAASDIPTADLQAQNAHFCSIYFARRNIFPTFAGLKARTGERF